MADQDIRVRGPVQVADSSKERVAYDLMEKIGALEGAEERKTREYWLKLYSQCLMAVGGYPLEEVLRRR